MPLWSIWFAEDKKLAKYAVPPRDILHDVRSSILKKLEARLVRRRPPGAKSTPATAQPKSLPAD